MSRVQTYIVRKGFHLHECNSLLEVANVFNLNATTNADGGITVSDGDNNGFRSHYSKEFSKVSALKDVVKHNSRSFLRPGDRIYKVETL